MKFDCGCQYKKLDWDDVPLDCPAVWDMIGQGLTKGVFQVEKSLGRRWCKKIKPRNILELSDVMSLIRPGCLQAQYREDERTGKMMSITDTYLRVRNKEIEAEYIHPALEPILKDTYGVPVYQEQIMNICVDFAGFTLQDADDTRKAVGKKDEDRMVMVHKKFIIGAIEQGNDKDTAETIFSWINEFSSYGFNKCVSGNTVLNRGGANQYSSGMYTVEHLYKLVNDYDYAKSIKQIPLRKKLRSNGYGNCMAVCEDGRIRPMPIKTIHRNGKKKVVRVTDNGGRGIICTLDHKFMTPNGTMRAIEEIGVGGQVLCHVDCYDDEYIYNYNLHSNRQRDNKGGLVDSIGRKNAAFIDGNWKKFESIKNKYENIDYCQICLLKPSRLEWHHMDGNRSNNCEDNLIKLCVSCHKKEDYKLGRNKRFDKGHKIGVATIINIEELCEHMETYDVEMDTLEHNWIANGFAVSNSHGVGYALQGYYTAYSKVHFPIEFFKNMLTYSDSKQDEHDEIKQLIHEARLFGIEILLPDAREGNKEFEFVDEDKIRFGLTHIKNIGPSAIATLKPLKDIKTEAELFSCIIKEKLGIKKNIIEALIKSGALDYCLDNRITTLGRFRMLNALTPRERVWLIDNGVIGEISREWLKQLVNAKIPRPLDKRLAKIGPAWDAIKNELGGNRTRLSLSYEKFHLGMAISGSEVDLYLNPKVNSNCRDFLRLPNKSRVAMGVLIEEVRQITDKRGQPMCFLKVSDSHYLLDGIVVFASVFNKCGWIIEEGKVVMIKGRKQDTSLLVDKIEHL